MKIGVVGLGLIGGSIFKALRDDYNVVGISSSVKEENVSQDYETIKDCDLVFVCTPMSATLEVLDKVRGEKGAVSKIFERMQEMGYKGGKVLIDNCCNLPAAKALQELVLAKFPKAQVEHDSCKGLCSFYAEKGGLMIGFECN